MQGTHIDSFFHPLAVHPLRELGRLLTASCICTDQKNIDHVPCMSNDCGHMHYAGKRLPQHRANNVIIFRCPVQPLKARLYAPLKRGSPGDLHISVRMPFALLAFVQCTALALIISPFRADVCKADGNINVEVVSLFNSFWGLILQMQLASARI